MNNDGLSAHDLRTPLYLRALAHLSHNWYLHVFSGIILMPAAIEAGMPLAGCLGYIQSLAGVLSAPRTVWPRLNVPKGPLRTLVLVTLAHFVLRGA